MGQSLLNRKTNITETRAEGTEHSVGFFAPDALHEFFAFFANRIQGANNFIGLFPRAERLEQIPGIVNTGIKILNHRLGLNGHIINR